MKTVDYNIITDYNKIDKENWSRFVKSHSNSNIFQSPEMYEFYKHVDNYEPIIVVVEFKGNIIGVLCGVLINESGIKGFFSKRCIIWGGPLTIINEELEIKNKITGKLINEFNRLVDGKAIYTEFRNLHDLSEYKVIFENEGYQFEEHLNYIIDLTLGEEELWKNVNQKRRNEIKRAYKENLVVRETTNESGLKESYKIIQEVYSRAKLPFPDLDFFKDALKILTSEHFKIFSAMYDGKVAGTMYTLCYNGIIYDWYAGSHKTYYSKYPNDLVPWEVFLWGKKNGFNKFDFGGAGKPNVPYGVRDYKKKFGGKMVNYGRLIKVNNSILYGVGKTGLKVIKMMK